MQFLDEIIHLLDSSIHPDASTSAFQGNIIKDGYNADIDTQRAYINNSHEWISEYQSSLVEQTGIASLKIKFTQNAGYFIEIPRSQTQHVPDICTQTQTLTQSSRYTTQELTEFQHKLFTAEETLSQQENDLFLEIYSNILEQFKEISSISKKIAYLDFLQSGAKISLEYGGIRPEFHTGFEIEIIGGKHPVISQNLDVFVSNDLDMDATSFIHILTGPNMWGKSTYLRQNALLILMAHMGYNISATSARMWIIDNIFSRVGAGDNLFFWQSTFMVEMQEIAYILRNATRQSFVIIDEIGRGTSTYDGMAIARAIVVYNQKNIGAKTLFATHYHEIAEHRKQWEWISNYSVAVGEEHGNIIFLRKIVPWAVKKSYGIEVAKLAGIPDEVLQESRNIIQELENTPVSSQLSLENMKKNEVILWDKKQEKPNKNKEMYNSIISKLKEIDINTLSPVEALMIVDQIKQQLKK